MEIKCLRIKCRVASMDRRRIDTVLSRYGVRKQMSVGLERKERVIGERLIKRGFNSELEG